MDKKELSTNAAKAEFVKSIHHWLMRTLEQNNKPEYKMREGSIPSNIKGLAS